VIGVLVETQSLGPNNPCSHTPSGRAGGYHSTMERKIVGFHRDDEGHWVAELDCGHNQHVRHDPPWVNRPWVTTEAGRHATLGKILSCKLCDPHAA
jgi:hypothetical protein